MKTFKDYLIEERANYVKQEREKVEEIANELILRVRSFKEFQREFKKLLPQGSDVDLRRVYDNNTYRGPEFDRRKW